MPENNVNPGAEAGADDQNLQENPGGQTPEVTPKTYTEKDLQAESDRRVQQALDKFRKEELPGLIKTAQSEAEKLAKLSAEERAQAEFDEQRRSFEADKKRFERERLELETAKELSARQLPPDFASFLTGADADATKASLDSFETAFRSAVQSAVEERLKNPNTPKDGKHSAGGTNPFAEETKNLTEQGRLYREDPQKAAELARLAGIKLIN